MKATIHGEKRISEGGCNACTAFALCVYNLEFADGTIVSLERLAVPQLVMAFAQADHWKQEFTMLNMSDEAMLYKKDGQTVIEEEGSTKVTYTKGSQKVTVEREYCDLADLYENTNQILTNFFNLEEIEFEYVMMERDIVL